MAGRENPFDLPLEDQEDLLNSLLSKWNCSHLLPILEGKKIDYRSFCQLELQDLKEILAFGDFVKIRGPFSEWRDHQELPAKRLRLDAQTEISIDNPPESNGRTNSNVIETVTSTETTVRVDLSVLAKKIQSILKAAELCGEILLVTTSPLESSDQTRLGEILITSFLNANRPKGELKSEFLIDLSHAVVEVFPEESAITYYSPYIKRGATVFQAKGKFVNSYNLWRQKGIEAGLIHGRKACTSSSASSLAVFAATDEEDAAVTYVRSNLGPEELILQKWSACHSYRIYMLFNDTNFKKSIHNYFATFPVLRQGWGFKLLLQDYDKLYPDSNSFLLQWPSVSRKLLRMFLKKKVVDSELVKFLEENIKDDGAGFQEILIHLSKLFPAHVVCKGVKGKHWSANKKEVQHGFMKHVLTTVQMNDFLVRRKAKLTKFSTPKKPIPFQPICVVVGPSISQIESSYCVVANETYKLDSPLEAFDCTFKALHALDLDYSLDCVALWRFIQHAVYKITTSKDDNIPCLPTLLKMFEKC